MPHLHDRASISTAEIRVLRFAKVCSAIVVVTFLVSLIGIKYVTNDDIWQAAWATSGVWFEAGLHIAADQGRLFKPASLALFVPYAIDHPAYYALTYLGPILLASILAASLLRTAIPVAGVGSLFVLLFFGFAQNSFEHNLFSAVPFVWESAWGMLLLSTLLLARAIEKQSMRAACMGALIFLIGMIEAFVPFTVLLVAIAYFSNGGLRRNGRYVLPYAVGIVLWVIAWIWWRHIHPSHYEGSSLDGSFSPARIVRTIWVYATGGAPFATLWNDTVIATAETFKEGFGIAWVLKAAAVACGLVLLAKVLEKQPRWTAPGKYFLGAAVLIFLPVVLLGFTTKYQEWVQVGSHAYVYSHFSYFAWIALLVLVLITLLQRFRSGAFLAILAILGGCGSIITDWSNYETNLQQKLSARKWETFDRFLASRAYALVPEGSRIHYLGLDLARGIAATEYRYWTEYSRARTGKSVEFVAGIDDPGSAVVPKYYLVFEDESRGYNQSILFARSLAGRTGYPVARDFSLVVNTRNDLAAVSGLLPECSQTPCMTQFTIDGITRRQVSSPMFSLELETSTRTPGEFDFRSDKDVDIMSIEVSFNRRPRSLAAQSVKTEDPVFSNGF